MRRFCCLFSLLFVALWAMAQAKYVFMFIGDGMGPHQVLSTEMYLAELEGRIGRKQLLMTTFPYSGQAATFSASSGITDSAASGTCLATGIKTNNNVIGLAHDSTPVYSVASQLKQQGWGVGIMTTVTIDHATPSAHYAHASSREDYYTIGTQLVESNFDFFGGAGFSRPIDQNDTTAPNLYDLAKEKGYTLAAGYADATKQLGSGKMILLPSNYRDKYTSYAGALPYAIDRTSADLTLSQIVEVAIAQLSSYDRFFMMAEGGKIDYASHANDGATVLHEVMDFDSAIQVAYRFYEQHSDETLIVITADHETGGLTLGRTKGYVFDLSTVPDRKSNMTTEQRADVNNYMEHTPVDSLSKVAKIGWTTTSHTGGAVPVFAVGAGSEAFVGRMDNIDIPKRIMSAMGLDFDAHQTK
jgi:alkaline phosphatase